MKRNKKSRKSKNKIKNKIKYRKSKNNTKQKIKFKNSKKSLIITKSKAKKVTEKNHKKHKKL